MAQNGRGSSRGRSNQNYSARGRGGSRPDARGGSRRPDSRGRGAQQGAGRPGKGYGRGYDQGKRSGASSQSRYAGRTSRPGQGGRGPARSGRPGRRPYGRQSATPQPSYIEGRRACAEALEAGVPLRRALVSRGEPDPTLASLIRRLQDADVPVEQVSHARLDQLSSHGAHQGIVVQAAPYEYATLEDIIERAGKGPALVVLLDHVTDEGNFGAIVRSAEVVGAAGVVIAKARAASVGTAAYKTSAGAVMHVPIAQVPNLGKAIEQLQDAGFWAGGATEHAHDDVWHAPMGGRLCLVMGSEDEGISHLVRQKCDFECRLPQRGRIESLNVAQAATVMCYEWLRRVSQEESGQVDGQAPAEYAPGADK